MKAELNIIGTLTLAAVVGCGRPNTTTVENTDNIQKNIAKNVEDVLECSADPGLQTHEDVANLTKDIVKSLCGFINRILEEGGSISNPKNIENNSGRAAFRLCVMLNLLEPQIRIGIIDGENAETIHELIKELQGIQFMEKDPKDAYAYLSDIDHEFILWYSRVFGESLTYRYDLADIATRNAESVNQSQ